MSKHVLVCDICNGVGYVPLQGQPKESFPKGDWLECPQCDTTRKLEMFEQRITPPKYFDIHLTN